MLTRRGIIGSLLAAPAIIKTAGLLMPISVAKPVYSGLKLYPHLIEMLNLYDMFLKENLFLQRYGSKWKFKEKSVSTSHIEAQEMLQIFQQSFDESHLIKIKVFS